MNVNDKMLKAFKFGLSVAVIAQQIFDLLLLSFLERDVVRVTAKNVFELTLELIDIVVVLSSEVELNFFILSLLSFFFFDSLVKIFLEVFDNAIVVVSMLFPELTQLLRRGSDNFEDSISNLQSFSFYFLQIFFLEGLFVDNEVTFSLVEPHIRRVDSVVLEESFLDISEGNSLLLVN